MGLKLEYSSKNNIFLLLTVSSLGLRIDIGPVIVEDFSHWNSVFLRAKMHRSQAVVGLRSHISAVLDEHRRHLPVAFLRGKMKRSEPGTRFGIGIGLKIQSSAFVR